MFVLFPNSICGNSLILPKTYIRCIIPIKAGTPSQCALNELRISPRNKKEIACPKPQPGHQVIPSSLNGHSVKCVSPFGLVTANAISAAIQKTSSKYLKKFDLINFITAIGKQYRYPEGK